MTLDPQNPAPGVYENVDFPTYCATRAVNRSLLEWMQTHAPLHCHYHAQEPEEEEDYLTLGRAVHALLLAPDRVAGFAVAKQCMAMTGKGTQCSKGGTVKLAGGFWYCTQHTPVGAAPDPVSVLSPGDWDAAQAMAGAVLKNTAAAGFLTSGGPNEVTLVWRDEPTGLLCKGQLDALRPSWEAIGDLKTTAKSCREFARTMATYGLHRQAAYYLDGAQALGLPVKYFAFLPVESDPPHGAATFQIGPSSVELGRDQMRQLLNRYAECERTGRWEGYTQQFETIELPAWEFKRETVTA